MIPPATAPASQIAMAKPAALALMHAIVFLVFSKPAIISVIDFWGGDRNQGIFAERSPFLWSKLLAIAFVVIA
jgi:hypothetical protein